MIVRIYADPNGESHFEEINLPPLGTKSTSLQSADSVTFIRSVPGTFIDWHPAPRRQFVVTLAGQTERGSSDGTVLRFGPGDVCLVEDLTGKGHTTRSVGNEPHIFVVFPVVESK